jgi:hypothetical protein
MMGMEEFLFGGHGGGGFVGMNLKNIFCIW